MAFRIIFMRKDRTKSSDGRTVYILKFSICYIYDSMDLSNAEEVELDSSAQTLINRYLKPDMGEKMLMAVKGMREDVNGTEIFSGLNFIQSYISIITNKRLFVVDKKYNPVGFKTFTSANAYETTRTLYPSIIIYSADFVFEVVKEWRAQNEEKAAQLAAAKEKFKKESIGEKLKDVAKGYAKFYAKDLPKLYADSLTGKMAHEQNEKYVEIPSQWFYPLNLEINKPGLLIKGKPRLELSCYLSSPAMWKDVMSEKDIVKSEIIGKQHKVHLSTGDLSEKIYNIIKKSIS